MFNPVGKLIAEAVQNRFALGVFSVSLAVIFGAFEAPSASRGYADPTDHRLEQTDGTPATTLTGIAVAGSRSTDTPLEELFELEDPEEDDDLRHTGVRDDLVDFEIHPRFSNTATDPVQVAFRLHAFSSRAPPSA